MPCNNSQAAAAATLNPSSGTGDFCIFDFLMVLPVGDQWEVIAS